MMLNLLKKECKLSASILSFLFLAFALMTFIPNYPILCGVFFITLGIFQSFQNVKETNDIVFSALLPIPKKDVVKGKYIFCIFIELCGMIITIILTIIRMLMLSNALPYVNNQLMNANLFFIAMAFILFGLFNIIFVNGFFKTAYKVGKPFVIYIIICFIVIAVFESLHFFPKLEYLNTRNFDFLIYQIIALILGITFYILITLIAYRKSIKNFNKIDL